MQKRNYLLFVFIFLSASIFVAPTFASSAEKKSFFANGKPVLGWKSSEERRILRKAKNQTLYGDYAGARKSHEKLVAIDSFHYNFELSQ